MATLEVHDSQGRVQFVELARDHPMLFGTSAACDVLLEGEGVLPVHGRISWKRKRFRVEASPDAEFVLINGTKMTAGSIHQGDEVVVGSCRMFLFRVDDDAGPVPARSKAAVDEGKTAVIAAPFVPVQSRTEGPPGRDHRRSRSRTRGKSANEREDWLSSLQKQAEVAESLPLIERTLAGVVGNAVAGASVKPPAKAPSRWRAWEMLKRVKGPQAPGQERILSSPLVLGLVACLIVLVAMMVGLFSIIAATAATQTFNQGVQNFDDGDYRTSIRAFTAFLQKNPEDQRAGKAHTLLAMANVRQYVSPEGGTWSLALEASRQALDELGGVEEFRDVRADLGELIIRVGEGLAERARTSADPKVLAEAESAVSLHAQAAGEPALALAFLNRSRLPAKLTAARAAVRKAQVRTQAFEAMDKALADGSATHVYDARDGLVAQYADLARDKDLIARMTSANELIRRAVVVDKTRRPAGHEPRPDPLGPTTSLVWRSSLAPAPAGSAPDAIVFALADGFAYALDGNSGAPLWQVPLGLASSYVPRMVRGEATALAFDARHDELVKLDATNGALIWRLAVGEPVSDPPLVLGNQLFQVLPSGKIMLIALDSGELQSTINLGRPLARTPAHDESGQHLYVLGRQDCLFILARDPLACVSVVYLGHLDGSIPCSAAMLGRFLVVPENESLADSRWHVLLVDEDGVKVQPVQQLDVSGWTWSEPVTSGTIVWAVGDKGGYEAFSVGDYGGTTPFRLVARLTADTSASGPAYALAKSDRDLWVASGRSGRFELDAEHGKIQAKAPLAQPGPARAPIQTAGRFAVMTFQDQETGGVSLWGIDAETGAIAWKSIVAAPWPAPLEVSTSSGDLVMVGRDGRDVRITREQIAQGSFIAQLIPRVGEFALPAGSRLRLEAGGKPLSVIAPNERSNQLWVNGLTAPGSWHEVGLPTAPASDPIAWGSGVLIPGLDSRVYLIDPLTGRSQAEPFVPKFDRDRQGTWFSPARLDKDTVVLADDVGRIIRLKLETAPVARLVGEAERLLDHRIIAGPASTGNAVIVATADRHVRALAARDLSPVGTWALDAPLAAQPVGVAENCFVMDRAGGVMAFSQDGQRAWSIKLDSAVVGAPMVRDQLAWFLTQRGKLHVVGMSKGENREIVELGALPSGGLLMAGKQEIVPAGRGTIRPVAAMPAGENRP